MNKAKRAQRAKSKARAGRQLAHWSRQNAKWDKTVGTVSG